MSEVLARQHRALSPEETERLLRERLDDGVQATLVEFGVFTVWVAPHAWAEAARLCRDEWRLAYDLFDCLFGVDAGDDGIDVVAVLYSTTTGNRIVLRTRCEGGREAPVCPSLTDVYRGANWMERETYDMFGVDFTGHPGLEPRLLTVENFEGWPLRKDFYLASRVVKPWPGVNEPQELDEDGNVIERETRMGDAPGPYDVDKAIAEQAKAANPLPEAEREKLEAEQAADAAESKADAAPEVELDQETYDRLIAEGKSERMARSKAKAAWMKQKKAAERAAADGASGDEATSGDDEATTGGAASSEAADSGEQDAADAAASGDEATEASEKADQRRREQAEARARKAAERAAESDAADESGAGDETGETDGADETGEADESGGADETDETGETDGADDTRRSDDGDGQEGA